MQILLYSTQCQREGFKRTGASGPKNKRNWPCADHRVRHTNIIPSPNNLILSNIEEEDLGELRPHANKKDQIVNLNFGLSTQE